MRRFIWGSLLIIGVAVLIVHPWMIRHAEVTTVEYPYPQPAKPRNVAVVASPTSVVETTRVKMGARRPPSAPAREEPMGTWRKTITSSYLPRDAAEEEVWDLARTSLVHDLRLSAVPSKDFMNQWVEPKIKGEKKGPDDQSIIGETVQLCWDMELAPEGWRQLARQEKSYLAHQRMETTARTLAILTVLFGAIAGYIRLDEFTKGYYTGRLRLATLVLVVAVGAFIAHV